MFFMGYSAMIQLAYRVTASYPGLWLLGIFLATSFNAQLLLFDSARIPVINIGRGGYVGFFGDIFGQGVAVSIAVIFFVSAGLILTNWAKVFLIMRLQKILPLFGVESTLFDVNVAKGKNQRTQQDEMEDEQWRSVLRRSYMAMVRVVVVSLFTTALMGVTLAVLSLPFMSFARGEASSGFMWASAGLLLAGSAFVVSILGMFASFFIVLLRMTAKSAINVSVDLIATKWHEIVGSVIVFGMVYLGMFFLGAYVVVSVERLVWFGNEGVAQLVRNMLLWGWLSVLNVFFYTAMLILFVHLVRPKKSEEVEVSLSPQRAGASEI
jgi:hypothetical protein